MSSQPSLAKQVENIDATASAKLLTGPWQVEGTASHDEERYRIGVLTGSWQEPEQIRLTVDVDDRVGACPRSVV